VIDEPEQLSRRPSQEELDAVSLAGRDLSGVVLRKVDLTGRDLRETSFVDAVLNSVIFDNCALGSANFSGAEIDGSSFVGAQMKGAVLEGVRGEGVDFSNADLAKSNFKQSELGHVKFSGASLDGAVLAQSRWVQVEAPGLSAVAVRARGWVLDKAEMRGANLERADLGNAVFQEVSALGVNFSGADFRKAKLVQCDWKGADLSEIQAQEAQVKGVELDAPEARQFHRAGAKVGGLLAQWSADRQARKAARARGEAVRLISPWTVWGLGLPVVVLVAKSAGSKPAAGLLFVLGAGSAALQYWSQRGLRAKRSQDLERVGPGVDLRGGQLNGVKLAGRDLQGIDLRNANLQGADLSGADLAGAKLDGARLDRCCLVGANLKGVSARGSSFDDVRGSGLCLESIDATDSSWVGADLRGSLFAGSRFVRADLSAGRLCDVDFVDCDLSGANLEQCDLAGAELSQAKVEGLEAEGALGLSGAELTLLESRGAQVNALSVNWSRWLSAEEGRARRLSRMAAFLVVFSIGGFLVSQYLDAGNLSDEELEGRALEDIDRGDLEAGLVRYELLFERSEKASEKMVFLFEMAGLLSEAKRHDEAIAKLGQAEGFAEAVADQAEVAIRLAEAHGAAGDLEAEIAGYEALAKREDVPPDLTARALVSLSEVTARMGFPDRAMALHETVLKRFGSNPSVVLRVNQSMAELLAARGQYGEALVALERISAFPLSDLQRAELLVKKASLFEEQGLQVESLEIYKKLKTRYPKYRDLDGQVLLSMARLTARQGQTGEAKSLILELLARGAKPAVLVRSQLLLGQILETQGDVPGAIAAYRKVLTEEDLDRDAKEAAQMALANALLASGAGEAESLLEELIAGGDPELASQALLGQAHSALASGDTDAARGVAERVLAEFQAIPGAESAAKSLLAQIFVAESRYPEAVRAYRGLLEVAERSDERVVLQAAIADALLQGGRVKEAQKSFESMLRTDGDHPEAGPLARLGLARVAETLGNHEKARRLYRQVAENAADPALQSAGLEYLALAYLDAGQDQEAMQAYRQFVEALPDGHDAGFTARLAMAGILMRRGDNAQAQVHYEALMKSANTTQRSAEIEFALGELREQAGDLPGALAAYASIRTRGTLPLARRIEAGLGLARVQLALGDATEALRLANETDGLVQAGAIKVSLLQLRIQALQSLGRGDEAATLSEQLLAVAGDDEDAVMVAQLELARNKADSGDFSGAIALYTALGGRVSDRPTQAAMQISVAQVHAQSGNWVAARKAYMAVLEGFGNLVDTRFECQMGLANVDRMEGNPEAALARYRGIKVGDAGSDIWRLEQMAQTHWESDNEAAARTAFESIQENYPAQPAALAASKTGLAKIAQAQGELELARGLFSQVAELSRDRSQREWAQLSAAGILSEQGRYDDAFFAFRGLAGSTSDPEVTLQAKLGMAAVLQEKGRFEQALALLETAEFKELGPAWAASVTQALVSSELALGRFSAATARWKSLLADWSDHDESTSQASLGLAQIALQQGQTEQAMVLYKRVASESADRFFQAQAQIGVGRVLVADGKPQQAADGLEAMVTAYPDQPEMIQLAQSVLEGLSN
jgi:uncharacterized protein YjbI with pentapeptide repeats/tetratricopeptide (TPR) repeat protein